MHIKSRFSGFGATKKRDHGGIYGLFVNYKLIHSFNTYSLCLMLVNGLFYELSSCIRSPRSIPVLFANMFLLTNK